MLVSPRPRGGIFVDEVHQFQEKVFNVLLDFLLIDVDRYPTPKEFEVFSREGVIMLVPDETDRMTGNSE